MPSSSLKLTSLATGLALIGQLISATGLTGQASAADMLADETYEYTPVEFGTGWYLRGDIGGGFSNVTVETSFLNGDADLGKPVSFSVGAGYTFAEGLRAEFMFNHFNNLAFSARSSYPSCGTEDHDGDGSPVDNLISGATAPIPVTGNCFVSANAEVAASTIMANAYADLGTYWGIRPYIGAGIGAAYVSWNNFNYTDFCSGIQASDCGTTTGGVGLNARYQGSYTTENSIALAANAMLGLSYDLTQDLTFDLGYRYTYIGETGVARAAANAGNFSDHTVGGMSMHEIRIGLRYEIW